MNTKPRAASRTAAIALCALATLTACSTGSSSRNNLVPCQGPTAPPLEGPSIGYGQTAVWTDGTSQFMGQFGRLYGVGTSMEDETVQSRASFTALRVGDGGAVIAPSRFALLIKDGRTCPLHKYAGRTHPDHTLSTAKSGINVGLIFSVPRVYEPTDYRIRVVDVKGRHVLEVRSGETTSPGGTTPSAS